MSTVPSSPGRTFAALLLVLAAASVVGKETRLVEAGGIWRIPSNTPHTITGGSRGAVVVDIFSTPRDDWAAHERLQPRPTQWPQPEH